MKDNNKVLVVLYGQSTVTTREKAKEEMLECMMCSEGAERERYTDIYLQLLEGRSICSDGTKIKHQFE